MFMSVISSFSFLKSLSLGHLFPVTNTASIVALTSLLDNAMLHLNFFTRDMVYIFSCLH